MPYYSLRSDDFTPSINENGAPARSRQLLRDLRRTAITRPRPGRKHPRGSDDVGTQRHQIADDVRPRQREYREELRQQIALRRLIYNGAGA